MKFKVGEKVRVREDLEVSPCVTCTMVKYKGRILTVEDISGSFYILRECGRMMLWIDEMLEPAEEINLEQYKKDQVQQIKKENEKNCDNCKLYDTYFDCSQCEDFDEWQEKPTQKDKPTQAEEINKSTKEVTLTYLESINELKAEIRKVNKTIKKMMEDTND